MKSIGPTTPLDGKYNPVEQLTGYVSNCVTQSRIGAHVLVVSDPTSPGVIRYAPTNWKASRIGDSKYNPDLVGIPVTAWDLEPVDIGSLEVQVLQGQYNVADFSDITYGVQKIAEATVTVSEVVAAAIGLGVAVVVLLLRGGSAGPA